MLTTLQNTFFRATTLMLLFWVFAGTGCASDNQEVQSPPSSVLSKLNSQCVDALHWQNVSDPAVWCLIKFQVVDGDHGSVPFGTGSSPGTVCDGSTIFVPAGLIGLNAFISGYNSTETLPFTMSGYCGMSVPHNKIQLSPSGASIAYGCGNWCMDQSGIITLAINPSYTPKLIMYVQNDPRCSGAGTGGAIQYTIMTDSKHISIDYQGCSTTQQGNTTYITYGTIVITAKAYATKSLGNVVCLPLNCN
jgi:hypothetical protein